MSRNAHDTWETIQSNDAGKVQLFRETTDEVVDEIPARVDPGACRSRGGCTSTYLAPTRPGCGSRRGLRMSNPDHMASELTTSPPWVVLVARQIGRLTEFLTNRTLPSHITALSPPGWRLRAAIKFGAVAIDWAQGGFLMYGYWQKVIV